MTLEEFLDNCEQEYQCWRMYGWLVEIYQDGIFISNPNIMARYRNKI